VRLNLKKIKHLYFIYGSVNAILVLVMLLIVLLFYLKYVQFEKFSIIVKNEQVKLYHYKQLTSDMAVGRLDIHQRLESRDNTQLPEIISELAQSKSNINSVKETSSIKDIQFKENITSLVIDYEDLEAQNNLLISYLNELGDQNEGLFFKLIKSAADFSLKLKDQSSVSAINYQFSNLVNLLSAFLNNRNDFLAKEIEQKMGNIEKELKALDNSYNNYLAVRILDSFQNFKDNYYDFVKKAFEIGFSLDKGLLSKLDTQYSRIELRLNHLSEILNDEKSSHVGLMFFIISIIILLDIAFNVFAVLFFINSFNTFNSEIEKYVLALGKGLPAKIDYSKLPLETHGMMHSLSSFAHKLINSSNTAALFAGGRPAMEGNREDLLEIFYDAFSKIKQNIDGLNQKVREEQKKQTNMLWIKSGIDKLTEVMRREYDNPLLHANEIINMLIKFLNIPVGAIYHLREEGGQKFVEMMSSFAYGKEKQLYKKIAFGEGIIGTAVSERKTLNITSVPDGYFKIISGFGEAKPKNILISPIKLNEEIYGVIELASLSRFKQEEIDFVEEVCKTVAYSFAISKVYIDTLYQYETANMEMSQLEAENTSLSNDYEDLNQNYKLMLDRGADNSFMVEKLNEIAIIFDLDLEGNIMETNAGFEQFFKASRMKILQSNFREYLVEINASEDIDIEYVWKDARSGIQREIYQKLNIANSEFILQQYYFPVKDNKGRVKKVKVIAFDITNKINEAKENVG